MAVSTPICNFGEKSHDFSLRSTEDKLINLNDVKGENGYLIMFICNHCPYVKAIINFLVNDVKYLQSIGIKSAAIMSNDTKNYPEDSFENMKKFSEIHGFTFPYLYDKTQEIAKKYGAVCTPDFFGYNKKLELQYRGRLDNAGISGESVKDKELLDAFDQIIKTGKGPIEQKASMGCSIKWK